MNRWKWVPRLLVYPLLIVGGCHTLMTGSPIPLWHLENLESPVAVLALTHEHLVLQDGRKISLPFIKSIPYDNPLFKAAIANGIEITSDGEVYGLIWRYRHCGNDPVAWIRLRENLSDLAGALQPEGIDPAVLPSETISFLAEQKRIKLSEMRSIHDRGQLTTWDRMKMDYFRTAIDDWAEQQKKAPVDEAKQTRDDEEK